MPIKSLRVILDDMSFLYSTLNRVETEIVCV